MSELYHHGVKGMKWGVRRYVNEDGSLTPEGKKRYYNDDGSLTRKGKWQKIKLDTEIEYNQVPTYNRAAERFNRELSKINSKYSGDLTDKAGKYNKLGKKYVAEVNKKWKNIYLDEISKTDSYKKYLWLGKDYIADKSIMFNMYDDIDKWDD